MVKIDIEEEHFDKLKMLKELSDLDCSMKKFVGAMIDVAFDDMKASVKL